METRAAYNIWAQQYDTNENKTRDLEAKALREVLAEIPFSNCLEIGCGTGKNTQWLITKARVTGVDLSEEMLQKAKQKIMSDKVEFIQADITKEWTFGNDYDLVTFSLVLEHIEDLQVIFQQVAKALKLRGHVYVGELHPFKQYSGSKARFETEEGVQVVNCFTHHVSDFFEAAKDAGLEVVDLREYFDDGDRTGLPRLITILFKKV
jgi:2-polyprenyl-3-methyl-5-hydroxy-6-metoxy-1,4-benzoquinol methylase